MKKETTRGELIGKKIEITQASNKKLVGIKGTVIDETKNMLELDNGKKLIKDQITITMQNENITLDGKNLVGRSEQRIKKVKKFEN